jgi:hypothetical protein
MWLSGGPGVARWWSRVGCLAMAWWWFGGGSMVARGCSRGGWCSGVA